MNELSERQMTAVAGAGRSGVILCIGQGAARACFWFPGPAIFGRVEVSRHVFHGGGGKA